MRGNYLLTRAFSKWNGPPKRVMSVKTIQMFKTRLDVLLMGEWFEVYLEGFVTLKKTAYIFLLTPE